MMRVAVLFVLVGFTLSGCGGVSSKARPDYGEDAIELRFEQEVISSTASRNDAMAMKATEVCHGEYEKIGERMDSPAEIVWIIRCLKSP